MKKKRVVWYLSIVLAVFLLAGCSSDIQLVKDYIEDKQNPAKRQTQETQKADNEFRALDAGEYDSADTAVVEMVDTRAGKITLLNTVVNRDYTLSYDGTTFVTDQFGSALTMEQLSQGDIVDVFFRRTSKLCLAVSKAQNGWKSDDVTEYGLDTAKRKITFHGEVYSLAKRMVVRSEGEEIPLEELKPEDVLTITGMENTVYGIVVKDGHGYLSLAGDDYFLGGWIEVGQKVVKKITGDMMLAVPEGTYQVVVRHDQHGGAKEVTIRRGKETVLDVSDLKGEEIKTGNVFFTLTPPEASVYIDGEKVDTSTYLTLEYGIHQMIVTADGYETITQYLRVGQENANLNVEMEPSEDGRESKGESGEKKETDADGSREETEETEGTDQEFLDAFDRLPVIDADDETDSSAIENREESIRAENQGESIQTLDTTTPAGTYVVRLNAPEGAEVYMDGNYIGICPVSFQKAPGKHVVSLRRKGYQTRSYTIQVDEQEKDMELSFSELIPRREE